MLHEFLVYVIARMDAKGETFSADHCMELLTMIQGMTQEEGMARMAKESEFLKHAMRLEAREHGSATAHHGVLWTQMLNVDQAIRAGNGELHSWRAES